MSIKTGMSSKIIRILSVLILTPILVLMAVVVTVPGPTKAAWAGNSFTLTVDVSTGGGNVKIDLTEPISLPFTETYDEGTVIQIEAIPSFGYTFNGWKGYITSTNSLEYIIMDCNKYIAASFKVDWRLIGTSIGSLVLIIFLVVVLIIRRKSPAESTP